LGWGIPSKKEEAGKMNCDCGGWSNARRIGALMMPEGSNGRRAAGILYEGEFLAFVYCPFCGEKLK